MKEATTLDHLMEQISCGSVELVDYDRAYSDRLVRLHHHGTPQQHMETLERSEYKLAVPLAEDVTIIPLEDSAA